MKAMTRPILIGILFVPVILGVNYGVTEHYKRVWLDEATEAAHKVGAKVSDVKLPHPDPDRSKVVREGPNNFLICGYVDGRRFQYDIRDQTLAVDDRPGIKCDSRFY